MHIIELEKSKEVRVSFEKIEELTMPNFRVLQKDIIANEDAMEKDRYFCLEIMLPANASYYALLGARYMPVAEHEGLRLEVRYSEHGTENYNNTLAYSENTVFKGLSKEYVKTVLNVATDYLRSGNIPQGKIVFDTAAYCEVGSSPLMFRIATKAILRILLNDQYPISDSELKNICEGYLEERNKLA
jgi:hypothetical protein